MKLTGARIESFLRNPDPAMGCVLVYGPDTGLVRERANGLVRKVVDDPGDPFRVVELTAAALKGDPARLGDEARALSLTGGERVVRVREASDGVAAIFKDYLAQGSAGAWVIVEAGELGPRSSLRKLFEGAKTAAALACYGDDDRALRRVIEETLRPHGLGVSRDAMAYLLAHLGSDRLVTRGELDKLALFMGSDAQGETTITLDDAVAAVGDSAATSLDDVIYALADGNRVALDRALERAWQEGLAPVTLLRAVGRHFQRLHLAAGVIAGGRSAKDAMAALRPPVIFKFADRFRGQLGKWPPHRLAQALDLIIEAEADCKTTGLPAQAVCGRALLRLSQAAAARRA